MNRTRISDIEFKNVTHRFAEGDEIFKDVNFHLPLGKNLLLEGPPGGGKSMLLRMLAGVLHPTHGDVLYNGISLKDMSFEEFVPLRLSTSICFETGGLLSNKTVLDNLKLSLVYHHQWRAVRSSKLLDEMVEHFGLGRFLNLKPSQISIGIRKIAGLVRVFLSNAQVIYLDEPTFGVGDAGIEALKYWLAHYEKGRKPDEAIVVASSDRQFIEWFHGDRWHVENGLVVPKPSLTQGGAA